MLLWQRDIPSRSLPRSHPPQPHKLSLQRRLGPDCSDYRKPMMCQLIHVHTQVSWFITNERKEKSNSREAGLSIRDLRAAWRRQSRLAKGAQDLAALTQARLRSLCLPLSINLAAWYTAQGWNRRDQFRRRRRWEKGIPVGLVVIYAEVGRPQCQDLRQKRHSAVSSTFWFWESTFWSCVLLNPLSIKYPKRSILWVWLIYLFVSFYMLNMRCAGRMPACIYYYITLLRLEQSQSAAC